MSWHRKIDVRMWGDAKFRQLSRPESNGQSLFIYLISGPHANSLPGLYHLGELALCEAIGWPLRGFRKAFFELTELGMVYADFSARVIWVPNAIKYNQPESPNVVTSWGNLFDMIPECDLKASAYASFKASLEARGKPYLEAFEKAFTKASAKPMANQQQQQQQQQQQEREQAKDSLSPERLSLRKAIADGTGVDPKAQKKFLDAAVDDLTSATPPFTAEEVTRFCTTKPKSKWRTSGLRPSLNELVKNIHQVRDPAFGKAPLDNGADHKPTPAETIAKIRAREAASAAAKETDSGS